MKRFPFHTIRSLFAGLPAFETESVSDGELLDRFERGDSSAFELLVHRHAASVFGTCSRICRDTHDAEDAYQATFLILARKAKGIRRSGCVAAWLHRVAHRAATHAAVKRYRSRLRERADPVDIAGTSHEPDDLAVVLDTEINRLSDRYRLPVVLCYLEGLSTEAVASRLGIPRGTVLSRLATARTKLAARLTLRGVCVPAAAAGLFGYGAAESLAACPRITTSIFPPTQTSATLLAREVLRMGTWKTSATLAAALVAVAGLGGTVWAVVENGHLPAEKVAKAPPVAAEPVRLNAPKPIEEKKAEDDAQADRAKAERIRQREQVERLDVVVHYLGKQLMQLRVQYEEISLKAGHPEYDAKVLTDAIAKIDVQRLEAEDEKDAGKSEASEKLARLDKRRATLVGRLLKQQQDQLNLDFKLDPIRRAMAHTEQLAGELRNRLEYLKLELQPPAVASSDPTMQKLIGEVEQLRVELQKLREPKGQPVPR